MKFNIHHGQVRFQTDGKPYFRKKRPMGRLMMSKLRDGTMVDYRADALGNIDVQVPEHIDTMIGLGYPVYDGDEKTTPVPLDDLLWPSSILSSQYWRKIEEAKNLRIKT